MNSKYIRIILTICLAFAMCVICTACKEKKQQHIVVKYKSKYAQITKNKQEKTNSNIIDLSSGKKINYDYKIGPSDPTGPSFNLVTIDNP
ncbi:MAG: hypothetical protein ACI4S3_00110 [Candidatus Gastranaerophilaceae bacterium]